MVLWFQGTIGSMYMQLVFAGMDLEHEKMVMSLNEKNKNVHWKNHVFCSSLSSPSSRFFLSKPPKPPTFFPLEKPGGILMNFSSFLVKSQDLGLRIFPLNPENLGSALLFSPVRRLLCGFEFLGIFRVSHSQEIISLTLI
ncbi:hypothetical protein SLEP1_g55016 [Rubroshorea leprosula]|uniref:Uncharacterized protein n=1 Tax=Rubroshorea leprosula TaxID=152421 RepID=A0AAV5ME64_9ROSI|nr:hypothetical protein SLEP1_g55016 [Rubroshorea leprosula]